MLLENVDEVPSGAREPRRREKKMNSDDNMEQATVQVEIMDIEGKVRVSTDAGSQELSQIPVTAEVIIVDIQAIALDVAVAYQVALVEIVRRPHPMALTATNADVEVIRGMETIPAAPNLLSPIVVSIMVTVVIIIRITDAIIVRAPTMNMGETAITTVLDPKAQASTVTPFTAEAIAVAIATAVRTVRAPTLRVMTPLVISAEDRAR
mmetsp:Transcript_265/g.581  ORF Transcript_265/g.581 Transcript_265/m.581 type:complete len:208 (+) Transcript_265:1447-2070(+)